jgi:hypothetical protein
MGNPNVRIYSKSGPSELEHRLLRMTQSRHSRISLRASWVACRLISGFRFFAKAFDVGFGLIRCLIDVFTDLGNALGLPCRLYVDDDALPVGSANNPPIC